MTLQGRPLRFLALIMAGWIGWRTFMLWPVIEHTPLLEIPRAIVTTQWIGEAQAADIGVPVPEPAARRADDIVVPAQIIPGQSARSEDRLRLALAGLSQFSGRFVVDEGELGLLEVTPREQVTGVAPPTPVDATNPWQTSAWLTTRGGNTAGTRQLGGSQAGIVVRRALTDRIGSYARATAPLEGRGAELALGVDLQPGSAPIRLIAEHRFGLDGVRGGPALGAIAGVGPQPAGGMIVEAYGQAGVIWRDRTEPYGDGFVRVTRAVIDSPGGTIDLGVGAWGAAQRGAQRIDIGPSVGARIPIGGRSLRASIDWRERVAGDVRPGSGVALTIGTDF